MTMTEVNEMMSEQATLFTGASNKMDIKTTALNKALSILDALGAKYKVVASDGAEFGVLKLAVEPTHAKKGEKYGWGVMTQYVRPHLEHMDIGSVAVIPSHDVIEPRDVMASTAKLMGKLYGSGSYICGITPVGVEVLRVL
jgi:hypothetical protein